LRHVGEHGGGKLTAEKEEGSRVRPRVVKSLARLPPLIAVFRLAMVSSTAFVPMWLVTWAHMTHNIKHITSNLGYKPSCLDISGWKYGWSA
jgi:hypothetical protein